MTISYNWLREYIHLPESPEETGRLLTGTGLEVESIETFSTIKGNLEGLVIGEVLTCVKHPNADKLSLTTVDAGTGKTLHIVCGAPNVAAGQKVIIALPGTTLYPYKGEPFTIKTTKIRGEVSEGMICAEDEIGLSDNHNGIIVLTTNLPNGTPAAELYKPYSDYRIEIGLTPNRADAASHIGVARDLKAVLNREVKWPSVEKFSADDRSLPIRITIENPQACIRYSGVTISGVTVGESPAWLKNRLLSIGLTPINNIVDITNFVLHECGQPLHAFDADAIDGKHIIVKTLKEGTPFVTLDGKERLLTANDLMICDETKGLCIAGVFGGKQSGITGKTTNVFLESATFSSDYVRKTVLHHGLKTDAAFRFERGTDPNLTVYALQRAAVLIKEIAGGKISSDITDIYPHPVKNRTIMVKDRNVNRLIGKTIPREEVFSILKRLDIDIIESASESYTVSVPPYRVDVTQEADIVEEILRIHGFDNIELKSYTSSDYLSEFPEKSPDKFRRALGEMLAGSGFYEIWTNSLTRKAYQEKHQLKFDSEPVEILNKLSEEQGILRQTLLFTGLEVCAYNINRKQKNLKLFEFGKVYGKKDDACHEEERLALFVTGLAEAENWQRPPREVTWHDLAQHVYDVLEKSGITSIQQNEIRDKRFEYASGLSTNHSRIGLVGKVSSALLKDLGIKQPVFFAELDCALLFRQANPMFVFREVPRYPEVRRDLSLVLDKQVKFEAIRKVILATESRLIKELLVFDVYEGEKIPEGKKAYALGLILLDESKTLTDEEIDQTMQRLMHACEQQLGAVIRKQ
ncbi:MAG: phenylalanine--tRNA ligase subunit beta [Cyclobacteriaceae bacterium]|nr:phenylalanine--tRNA ligase subunit beta [Cyclobacteriaceae bacterium]